MMVLKKFAKLLRNSGNDMDLFDKVFWGGIGLVAAVAIILFTLGFLRGLF